MGPPQRMKKDPKRTSKGEIISKRAVETPRLRTEKKESNSEGNFADRGSTDAIHEETYSATQRRDRRQLGLIRCGGWGGGGGVGV